MRKGVAALTTSLCVVATGAACNRPPPPGSGAVETTGEKPDNAGSAGGRAQTMAAFPGGAVLVGDATNCTASRFESGAKAAVWSLMIPLCDGVMEAAVAPDSVSYVRVRRALVAIDLNGKETWRLAIDTDPVPWALLAPAVTLDSLVMIATGTRSIVAYKNDSTQAWRFGVAEDEVLVASPIGSRGEGIYLLTNRAVYNLAADGTLRFRRARTAPSG